MSKPCWLLCAGALLLGAPLFAQFADDDKRESRFINDLKAMAGVSPADTLLLNSVLEEAWVEAGRFQIWTRKNIKQKLAREAARSLAGCEDTSCLVKQANCKGLDGELGQRNGRYFLSLKLLSVEGTTLRSKTIPDLDIDDFKQMKALGQSLYRFLEDNTDFDESRFRKKASEAAPTTAPSANDSCDLIIRLAPQQVKQYRLEGAEVPVRIHEQIRKTRLEQNRLILQKLPSGRCDITIDWLHEEHRFTLTNRGAYLVRNETTKLPEDVTADLSFSVQKARVALTVTANLAGFPLFLNGERVGATPTYQGWAELGSNHLRSAGPGILPWETNVVAKVSQPLALEALLVRTTPLTLRIHSPVLREPLVARIFLDRKPLTEQHGGAFQIPHGEHELVIEKEGYEPHLERLRVDDTPLERAIELKSTTAWLSLSLGPEPCRVTLGSATHPDVTNLFLSGIPAGEHRLRIEHPDYNPIEEKVSFARNQQVTRAYQLQHSERFLKAQRVAMLTGERSRYALAHRKAAVGLVWKYGAALGLALTGTLLNLAADDQYGKATVEYQRYSAALLTSEAIRSRESITGNLSEFDILSSLGDTSFLLGSVLLIWGTFDLHSFRMSGVKLRDLERQLQAAGPLLFPAVAKDGVSLRLQAAF